MSIEVIGNVDFKQRAQLGFVPYVGTSAPHSGSEVEGELWHDSTNHTLKYWDGSAWTAAGMAAGTGLEISSGAMRIASSAAGNGLSGGGGSALAINLASSPGGLEINSDLLRLSSNGFGTGLTGGSGSAVTVDTSIIATKAYADGIAQGITAKAPVRAATTANITISTALNNGDTLDGVTLATNDRVLVKDQSTPSENGIYIVAASPSRATDWDASGEVRGGTVVWVQEGTTNADTGWVITTDDNDIVPGTDAAAFVQFSGLGQITAGAGLTKTGNTINVGAGTDMTVNADDITPGTNIPRKASANTFTAKQTIDPGSGDVLNLDVATNGDKWLELTKAGVANGSLEIGASDGVYLKSEAAMILETSSGNIVLDPGGGGSINANSHIIGNVGNAVSSGDAVSRSFGDGRYAYKPSTATNAAGSGGTFTFTNATGTKDISLTIRRVSDDKIMQMFEATVTTSTITVTDASNPGAGTYKAIIVPAN